MFEAPVITSAASPAVLLVFFGSAAAAAFAYAVAIAVRRRDPLPIALCIGALICALNEPIFDVLGKISYAENHPTAFTAFGRDIPWFLVIGYVPWVGLLPYLIAQAMRSGISRRTLHLIALVEVLSVVCVELVNLRMGAWVYYGEAPLKFFGGVAAMAGVPLVGGLVIYIVTDRLTGWRRLFAGLIIPTLVLPMIFAATGWPLYLALYSNLPPALDYVALAVMAALIIATVMTTTWIAQRWTQAGLGVRHGNLLEAPLAQSRS
jgi:hypothetical protein